MTRRRLTMLCPDCGNGIASNGYHSCPRRPDPRDVELAVLYHGGATLQEIGDAIGLTRQRIQQRLARIGIKKATVRPIGTSEVRLENISQFHRQRLGLVKEETAQRRIQRNTWRWRLAVAVVRELSANGPIPRLADLAATLGYAGKNSQAGGWIGSYLHAGRGGQRCSKMVGLFRELWEQAGVPQRTLGYQHDRGRKVAV